MTRTMPDTLLWITEACDGDRYDPWFRENWTFEDAIHGYAVLQVATVLRMDDILLDKLGDYFVHFRIRERYGITFEEFVRRVEAGTWVAYLAS